MRDGRPARTGRDHLSGSPAGPAPWPRRVPTRAQVRPPKLLTWPGLSPDTVW